MNKAKQTKQAKPRTKLNHNSQPLPSGLFSPSQASKAIQILGKYKEYYAQYYALKQAILKESPFIFLLWEDVLRRDILIPHGLQKDDWRLMLLVWALNTSKQHYQRDITRKYIRDQYNTMRTGRFVNTYGRLMKMRKLGYLDVKTNSGHTKYYFLTSSGNRVINDYARKYSSLFNDFFMPGL